jgi:MFS family permease
MKPIYVLTALHTAVHGCFTGSKVVLSLLALELGADPAVIGVLVACYALAPLTLGVYTGRLADSTGMRLPLMIGAAIMSLAMLTGYLSGTLAGLFAVAALVGLAFVFFMVAMQHLVGALDGNRTRNYSILTIGYSLSNMLGPLVAGFSIEYAGHTEAFGVFALSAFTALAVLAAHRALTRVERAPAAPAQRSALDLLKISPLRRTILMSGLIMACWDLYVFYLPIYGHAIGLSAADIGLVLATFAAATLVIRFVLSSIERRLRTDLVLAAAMAVSALMSAAIPFVGSAAALMGVSFVLGLGLGCGQPLALTLSFERSPAGRAGEVTGLRTMTTNLARLLVPLVSGGLGSAFGATPVFWMNALGLYAAGHLARRND